MPESTESHDGPKLPDPETAYGGADAVEKTTYVVGRGTDPRDSLPSANQPGGNPAPVGTTGFGIWFWIVLAIAVIVALIYVVGVVAR